MSSTAVNSSPNTSSLRGWLRQLGLGRLAMKVFFQPTAELRWRLSFGIGGATRHFLGEAAMRRAARRLAPIGGAAPEAFEATYMTGARFWHQTAFAAWSLGRLLPQGLRPTFYDDGSLREEQAAQLCRIFPHGRIVSRAEAVAQLDAHLPVGAFPLLREVERDSMFVRKLVTPRAGSIRWQLYLDSDMLFFRRPALLEEAARTRRATYMVDHIFAYCLPHQDLESLAGHPVRERVNGGMVALDDAAIDWPRTERWLAALPLATLRHAMLEQTLGAILVSHQDPIAADPEDYKILFSMEPADQRATLLHYIYHSKVLFVSREWRRVLVAHGTA
jgi:hypothetical protein